MLLVKSPPAALSSIILSRPRTLVECKRDFGLPSAALCVEPSRLSRLGVDAPELQPGLLLSDGPLELWPEDPSDSDLVTGRKDGTLGLPWILVLKGSRGFLLCSLEVEGLTV